MSRVTDHLDSADGRLEPKVCSGRWWMESGLGMGMGFPSLGEEPGSRVGTVQPGSDYPL